MRDPRAPGRAPVPARDSSVCVPAARHLEAVLQIRWRAGRGLRLSPLPPRKRGRGLAEAQPSVHFREFLALGQETLRLGIYL